MEEKTVLCGANSYEQKYYFNEDFNALPQQIKDELKIMCVLFTEDIGGIMDLEYDEDGNLEIRCECDEFDVTYDDIGCGLKIKQLQSEKRELFQSLETFFKVFVLGLDEDSEE